MTRPFHRPYIPNARHSHAVSQSGDHTVYSLCWPHYFLSILATLFSLYVGHNFYSTLATLCTLCWQHCSFSLLATLISLCGHTVYPVLATLLFLLATLYSSFMLATNLCWLQSTLCWSHYSVLATLSLTMSARLFRPHYVPHHFCHTGSTDYFIRVFFLVCF